MSINPDLMIVKSSSFVSLDIGEKSFTFFALLILSSVIFVRFFSTPNDSISGLLLISKSSRFTNFSNGLRSFILFSETWISFKSVKFFKLFKLSILFPLAKSLVILVDFSKGDKSVICLFPEISRSVNFSWSFSASIEETLLFWIDNSSRSLHSFRGLMSVIPPVLFKSSFFNFFRFSNPFIDFIPLFPYKSNSSRFVKFPIALKSSILLFFKTNFLSFVSSLRGVISLRYWPLSAKYWSSNSRFSKFLHPFKGFKSITSFPVRSRLVIFTAYSKPSNDFIPPLLDWVKFRLQSSPFNCDIIFSVIFWPSL